jgi:hypothetical protein
MATLRALSWQLADQLLGGELASLLREYRAARVSYRAIAELLQAKGIAASDDTVRRWCLALEDNGDEGAAA